MYVCGADKRLVDVHGGPGVRKISCWLFPRTAHRNNCCNGMMAMVTKPCSLLVQTADR